MGTLKDSYTVLVIGGTGYIGRAVVQALVSEGVDTIVGSRMTGRTYEANNPKIHPISLDVLDQNSVVAATANVDCVINCYREGQDERDSADAITNILQACKTNKVKKLVYLSSIAFYGEAQGIIDEWTPPVAPINWYGRAKSHAERACHTSASSSFHIAILRPTLVYGPGGQEWFIPFFHSIKSGHLGNLGPDGQGFANLIYLDDLAQMCSKLALSNIPQFLIIIANGTERITFNTYFEIIRHALGIEYARSKADVFWVRKAVATSRRIARGAIKVLRRILGNISRDSRIFEHFFCKIERALRVRPEDSRNYAAQTYYSPKQAQALGLAADTPLRDGVRRSVEWARQARII